MIFEDSYLKMLWPSHLTSEGGPLQLLLNPKKTNYIGGYSMFLEYRFVCDLKIDDLGTVLEWIMDNKISFDILSPYRQLGKKVFLRCIQNFG